MQPLRFFASALLGYLAVPLLNAVSPLLALPAITGAHGAGGWTAVAIGQSLGGTAGVIVELGWGLSGTQRAARMAPRNRARMFALSIVTKAIVGLPVLSAAAVLAATLSPGAKLDAAIIAVASGIAMFSGGWIFIGIMRPRLFLFTEVLPRAGLIAGAAVAIHFGGSLLFYPVALLVAALNAPVAGAIVLGVKWADYRRLSLRRALTVVRFQVHALTVNIFSSVYISLGTTVATLGSVNATLLYASVDRLERMVQQVMATQNYVLKGWVGREVEPGTRIRRAVRATTISAVVGLLCGTAFGLTSPIVADLVFSGTVRVPALAAVISGLTVAVVCTTMSSGFVLLVALNRVDMIARSALVGAIVGLPAIFFGAVLGGGTGALAGQLIAEVSVLIVQLVSARRRLRELRAERRWGFGATPSPGASGVALNHVRAEFREQ